MRRLMIGNEAIARGAFEAGATVATAYPGTPSTEIVMDLAGFPGVYAEWAPNEKVAMEVGIGASIGGARTLVAMKHVGVNVAADPLYTFSYTGVNAGLVLVSADDPGMHSSQNEQDNRGYGIFAKVPVIEPADSQEALDYCRLAFELSEEFDTPVMFRITTRLAHSQTLVKTGEPVAKEVLPYKKNATKYVMLPGFACMRHVEVEKRILKMKEYAEETPLNRIELGDRELGIITSGICYQYVKEVLPKVSVLKLGLINPLPEQLIRKFAAEVKRVVVIEELEPVIETQLKAWGIKVEGKQLFSPLGEYSPELIETKLLGAIPKDPFGLAEQVPGRPPVMCAGCPHRGVFYTLKKMRVAVMGDIGCYTLGAIAPLEGMDSCICMGASIGTAMGMEKARGREFAEKVVAVIGDSTFVHSGITPLIDVVYNQGNSTVLILDNDTTAMTGHQDHPATGLTIQRQSTARLDLEKLVKAIGVEYVQLVDPLNLEQLQAAVQGGLEHSGPAVIICKRPCVLIPHEPESKQYYIDQDICNGCSVCIRLGCPGLVYLDAQVKSERKAIIDANTCVNCGLCAQVCKFDAIKVVEE